MKWETSDPTPLIPNVFFSNSKRYVSVPDKKKLSWGAKGAEAKTNLPTCLLCLSSAGIFPTKGRHVFYALQVDSAFDENIFDIPPPLK